SGCRRGPRIQAKKCHGARRDRADRGRMACPYRSKMKGGGALCSPTGHCGVTDLWSARVIFIHVMAPALLAATRSDGVALGHVVVLAHVGDGVGRILGGNVEAAVTLLGVPFLFVRLVGLCFCEFGFLEL